MSVGTMNSKTSYEIQIFQRDIFDGPRGTWCIGPRSNKLNAKHFQKSINELKEGTRPFRVVEVTEKIIATHKS